MALARPTSRSPTCSSARSRSTHSIGSVAGAVAAALVLLLLAGGAAFAGELTGGATLRVDDLLVLALLPLALTVLATWVARTAVLAALREAL